MLIITLNIIVIFEGEKMTKCDTCQHKMSAIGYKGKLLCAAVGKTVAPVADCKNYRRKECFDKRSE